MWVYITNLCTQNIWRLKCIVLYIIWLSVFSLQLHWKPCTKCITSKIQNPKLIKSLDYKLGGLKPGTLSKRISGLIGSCNNVFKGCRIIAFPIDISFQGPLGPLISIAHMLLVVSKSICTRHWRAKLLSLGFKFKRFTRFYKRGCQLEILE